jgi:hypothetical protein
LKTPQKMVGGEPNGAGWQLTEETLVGRILAPAWTGHSERATLPSALAAFGVEKDKRTYLGRWSPEGGDVYVRTHRVVIKNCVMIFVREAKSPDVLETLAEDDIVAGVVDVIQAKNGVDMELVKAQAVGLLGRARNAYGHVDPGVGDAGAFDCPLLPGAGAVVDAVAEVDSGSDVENPGFVVSVSARNTTARLHRADGCWRARTLRMGSYEWLEVMPEKRMYNAVCRDCWPKKQPSPATGSSSSTSSSAST